MCAASAENVVNAVAQHAGTVASLDAAAANALRSVQKYPYRREIRAGP